jgi:uncharacterized membrane protein YkoI
MAAKKRSSATRKTGGRKSATKKKSSGARKKSATKKRAGRRYSKGAERKVGEAMHEMKRGKLRSGRSGKKVKSRKQAIAIGLSQARKRGAKVPRKKG